MLYYLNDWTFLLIIPALILSLYAQSKVTSTFNKYSRVPSRSGISAARLAEELVRRRSLNTQIQQGHGNLTDNFNPRNNTVSLSEPVYGSNSVASLGIAAHEIGHVFQHDEGYVPIKIRNAILPLAQIGSHAAMPLLLLGIIMNILDLVYLGIIVYAFAVLFQLVTLPVEFNASHRALEALADGNYLQPDELEGARKVLSAAALTYVAATLAALLTLLRFILLSQRRR